MAGTVRKADEKRHTTGRLWHSRVLRLRSDIFFFHPIHLPPLPDVSKPSFSFMEPVCSDLRSATHLALYGLGLRGRKRYVPDLWLYGTRAALWRGLEHPLHVLASEDASLRQDALQEATGYRAGRLVWNYSYYVHPWPHAMMQLFGSSACINAAAVVGVTRVNPRPFGLNKV